MDKRCVVLLFTLSTLFHTEAYNPKVTNFIRLVYKSSPRIRAPSALATATTNRTTSKLVSTALECQTVETVEICTHMIMALMRVFPDSIVLTPKSNCDAICLLNNKVRLGGKDNCLRENPHKVRCQAPKTSN